MYGVWEEVCLIKSLKPVESIFWNFHGFNFNPMVYPEKGEIGVSGREASERSPFDGSCCGGGYSVVDSLPPSPTDSEPPPPPRYRVVMLGDAGVGKTALVSQFMTSEYMHTYDASLGK
uniref:Uncharacterized protein n=1 Tax=Phlebotomus papatasi TaxID=29031 RepID=A0A1B0CZ11_PHLPP